MGVDLHAAEFAASGIILPPKDDLPVLQAEQTMVGDRYPMGVAGQIMQHMLWSAEGWLGIHHPILAKQRAQECGKHVSVRIRTSHGTRGLELSRVGRK